MTDRATRALPAMAGVRGMLAALILSACTLEPGELADEPLDQSSQAAQNVPLDLDVRRSLVVTEKPILARFGFERVLNQLVEQAHVPGLTAFELFLQWWDTNNPSEDGLGLGPNCNSTTSFVGLPFTCRPEPGEGEQTECSSLRDPDCAYIPIGLFNRFDLAPSDGAHCGEHRIVFAKQSGVTDARRRNLIIFEGILPNPTPSQGLKGCRRIVETWAELTAITDLEERAKRLEAFYFAGHGNVQPVVHISHYGDNALGAGQVRTNQFMNLGSGNPWSLREFKLKKKSCPGKACTMQMLPVTVKNNPFGPFFAASSWGSAAFQREFLKNNVTSLAKSRLADISMTTLDRFNAAQSNASGATDNDYPANFAGNTAFAAAIQSKLGPNSTLTPAQIVARAGTQSCAGCHQLSAGADLGDGLVWPRSLNFVHVSERQTEVVNGVTRFMISPALVSTFLPARKANMEAFLRP